MKKFLFSIYLIFLIILVSCTPAVSSPVTTSAVTASSGSESDNAATTPALETTVPETEQITYENGIFRALIYNETELTEIINSTGFIECETAQLVFAAAFTADKKITVTRPVSLVFNNRVGFSKGFDIITRESGEIAFSENGVGCFDFEEFFINAPLCDLHISAKAEMPEHMTVALYNNVKSYNNTPSIYGGTLDDTVTNVYVFKNDGTFLYKRVNELILYIPYSLSDGKFEEATLTAVSNSDCIFSDGTLTLSNNGENYVYSFTVKRVKYELPVLYINTDGKAAIASKTEYVSGNITLDSESAKGFEEYGIYSGRMKIRGRGNASWNTFPKKSYRIKLDEKAKLLGMNDDRDYMLVSAYPDKTLVRNITAHRMAAVMEHLEYTPKQALIDVFLNGEYIGVYTISEKIEFGGGKLEYTTTSEEDTSYLLEVGWDYNDEMVYGKNFFDTSYVERIVIKEPEIYVKYSPQVKFIMNYIKTAEASLKTLNGYDEYFDIDSMIDWMIVLELTNNTESAFYRSCYFYKPSGEKLKMGPVWDFDMAFGNHHMDNGKYNTFVSADTPHDFLGKNGVTWITLLMKDEAFVARLKARWNEKKEALLKTALDTVAEQTSLLENSQIQNFSKWNIMNKQIGESRVNSSKYNTFGLQVQYLTDFINTRYKWIDEELN